MIVNPIPAATLVIVRDSAAGPQVLLQQRSREARFVAGAWVFPGGKLDATDTSPLWAERCHGLDDATASARLRLPSDGLAWWIAAIRECFEEAGLLPLHGGGHVSPALRHAWRSSLTRGECDFAGLCEAHNLTLACQDIHFVSHWITPPGLPMRFDTRFFVMQAPPGQEPDHGLFEAIDTQWLLPEDALQRHAQGKMELILPTEATLKEMTGHADCRRLISHLASGVFHYPRGDKTPRGLQWLADTPASGTHP